MSSGRLKLIIFFTILTNCSVDYSLLDDRYCNSQNECIQGYVCDLATGKCIKENLISDIHTRDIIFRDINQDINTSDKPINDIENDLNIIDTGDSPEEFKDIGIFDIYIDSGICEANTYTCKDKDLYKCNENNELLFETTCNIDCKDDHCMECLPNEKICADDQNIKICNNEGLYIINQCSYKCYDNQCVICLPTDKYCDDKKAIKCNPTGTKWTETNCDIGCSAGECMICEPGITKICTGNDIYTCDSTGMDYEKTMNCCHDNNCTDGSCVITSPRVTDYSPKDWKVGDTIYWNIYGCFFVQNGSKVFIDYGGSWKEITEYNNYEYQIRNTDRIQIKVKVLTGTEFNFKVINPDGQETPKYPIKKHY